MYGIFYMISNINLSETYMPAPVALLAQEARREGKPSQLVYLEQNDEDD